MAPIRSKQPFKVFYTLLFLLKLPFILVLLTIRYALKQFRPLAGWSFKLCLTNALCREFFHYSVVTRTTWAGAVLLGNKWAKGRFYLAIPTDMSIYSGILTPGATRPAPVGGIWYPGPISSTAAENEKVILHFPGGSFVLACGFEGIGQIISKVMDRHLKATRTFVAQYRVATSPDTRFPAAIQDLLTSYHYILSLGVNPKDIILSGDSAGGNLVLALLRYLQVTTHLPLPGGAMVWSPWVHVTANAGKDYRKCHNSKGDVLVDSLLQWGADAYLPTPTRNESLWCEALPYISPLHHPFKISIPLFLNAGTGEAFYDSVQSFAQEMTEVNGERIKFHSTHLAPHGLLLAHMLYDMTSQLGIAAEDAYAFFEETNWAE